MRGLLATAALVLLAACAETASAPAPTEGSVVATAPAATPATAPVATVAPIASDPPTSSTPGTVPLGFATVAGRVDEPDGEVCDVCLWLADTPDLRGRGLMGVTDLGGRDGMVFVFEQPVTTAFTMRSTLIPLSIAFYGTDGGFLDAFDMVPCEAEPCPSYPTPADVAVAVEVPLGGLEALGMVPGSTLTLDPSVPCP